MMKRARSVRGRGARWLALGGAVAALWACQANRVVEPTPALSGDWSDSYQLSLNRNIDLLFMVDDSSSMDNEIFALEEFEGADWVLIADDLPVDEPQRDELLETFQATYHGGDGRQPRALEDPEADDDGKMTRSY